MWSENRSRNAATCWRRGWDLNPRDAYAYNGFRDSAEIRSSMRAGASVPDRCLQNEVLLPLLYEHIENIGDPDRIRTCDPQIRNLRVGRQSSKVEAANQDGCGPRIWTYFRASRSYRNRVRYRWLRARDLNLHIDHEIRMFLVKSLLPARQRTQTASAPHGQPSAIICS